jgi:hypothetical protein
MKTKLSLFVLFAFLFAKLYAQQPISWHETSPSNFVPMTVQLETTTVSEGTKSVKLTFTETGTPYYESDNFPVSGNTAYNCYLHVFDNDQGGEVQYRIRFYTNAGVYISEKASAYSVDSTGWRKIFVTGTSPATAAYAMIRLRILDVVANWQGSATFKIDNGSYTQGTNSTNLMPNPGFENWNFSITKAYNVDNNIVNVLFNGPLSSVNASQFQLKGVDTITFANAVISINNPNLVILSNPSAPIQNDSKLDSIVTTSSGSTKFYAGILPFFYCNVVNPDGVLDETNFATFKGVVTASNATRVWISDGFGPLHSINTYSLTGVLANDVSVGDEIIFNARRSPYDYQTELVDPMLISTFSANNPLFLNQVQGNEFDLNNEFDSLPAEKWEGAFIEMDNVKILSYSAGYYTCSDDNNMTLFRIGSRFSTYNGVFDSTTLIIGKNYKVKGVLVGRSGIYHMSLINPGDIILLPDITNKNVKIKAFLEGLFNGINMNITQNVIGNQFGNDISDVVSIEIRNAFIPYSIVNSFTNVGISTDGTAVIDSVLIDANNSYYLTLKQRNHLETWSAAPVSFSGDTVFYNFTTDATKAYGDNQKEVAPGVFAIYAGDVNQDGLVDGSDMSDTETDNNNFITGYIVTDINGDGLVDGSDMSIVEAANNNFEGVITP